jgi:ectoine hydroxylase-related dioxygenase (phytanoyl-CoA dioxygenase family)
VSITSPDYQDYAIGFYPVADASHMAADLGRKTLIALGPVDVDLDNGCLQVVPGSHRINRRPRESTQVEPLFDNVKLVGAPFDPDSGVLTGMSLP